MREAIYKPLWSWKLYNSPTLLCLQSENLLDDWEGKIRRLTDSLKPYTAKSNPESHRILEDLSSESNENSPNAAGLPDQDAYVVLCTFKGLGQLREKYFNIPVGWERHTIPQRRIRFGRIIIDKAHKNRNASGNNYSRDLRRVVMAAQPYNCTLWFLSGIPLSAGPKTMEMWCLLWKWAKKTKNDGKRKTENGKEIERMYRVDTGRGEECEMDLCKRLQRIIEEFKEAERRLENWSKPMSASARQLQHSQYQSDIDRVASSLSEFMTPFTLRRKKGTMYISKAVRNVPSIESRVEMMDWDKEDWEGKSTYGRWCAIHEKELISCQKREEAAVASKRDRKTVRVLDHFRIPRIYASIPALMRWPKCNWTEKQLKHDFGFTEGDLDFIIRFSPKLRYLCDLARQWTPCSEERLPMKGKLLEGEQVKFVIFTAYPIEALICEKVRSLSCRTLRHSGRSMTLTVVSRLCFIKATL